MKNFEYAAPTTVKRAVSLLSKYGEKAKIMAGGTDIIVEMRNRKVEPEVIVDLKRIPKLDRIELDSQGLKLGALVRIRDIETSKIIEEKFDILTQAARTVGSVQVRNKATIAGNISHATPSADMAPPLNALDAMITLVGPDGAKTIPIGEFCLGPGQTCIKTAQIVTEIRVPNMAPNTAGVYMKFSPRRAMDLAVVGVATVLTLDPTLIRCVDVRIVLGAVAPIPLRARKAEAVLKGKKLTDELIAKAGKVASEEAQPISDIRASEWYRRQIVEVLVKRTVHQAMAKLKGE